MGKKLQGFNLIFTGNIPQGSGLSSSAALEVVTALAISDLHKIDIEAVELALLAQRAENNFVNVQCGIMDQYISRLGKKDNALLIDCRTNEYLLVPFENEEYQIVICNSKVERGLVDSEYNKRRKECNQAVEFFAEKLDKNIKALRDLDLDTLHRYKEELSETVYKRAHHVISENKRVLAAKKALEANDMNNLGKLLYASHKSLSDDYEVSCDELDLLVDLASQQKGVKGARMTGAGFGGCTVNLVNKEYTADFVEKIKNKYYEKTNLKADIYITNPASGARKL
jgi:galactokinase